MTTPPPILRVTTPAQATAVSALLTQPTLFGTPPTPGEQEEFANGPLASLAREDHAYWFIPDSQGQPAGAIGVRMHSFRSGIFEVTALATAVNQRHHGFGRQLLEQALLHVKEQQGRGLLFDTSPHPSYEPMHHLLEHLGFIQVGRFPDFYQPGEDTLWYYRAV